MELPDYTKVGTFTGCYDKDKRPIRVGDLVRHNNERVSTKIEYWYPIYQVVFDAPSFTFRHWDGGKSGASYDFTLKYRQSELEIVGNIQDETA